MAPEDPRVLAVCVAWPVPCPWQPHAVHAIIELIDCSVHVYWQPQAHAFSVFPLCAVMAALCSFLSVRDSCCGWCDMWRMLPTVRFRMMSLHLSVPCFEYIGLGGLGGLWLCLSIYAYRDLCTSRAFPESPIVRQ